MNNGDTDMTNLSINEIRDILTSLEDAFSVAMDKHQSDIAVQIHAQIDSMWNLLVAAIKAEDPYATEADIRYFENNA
jgi:hypothetical protein